MNLRHAFRTLLKSPGFTCAAVLSLALGIGVNAAIFSIVNGLFLHPPGILEPAKVVAPQIVELVLPMLRAESPVPVAANHPEPSPTQAK